MSKKKLLTSITAVVLAATMVLGGTFAWQSISQTVVNEGSDQINPGGRLHDDYDGMTGDKDVYVENFATNDIFARIRLEEYFKVAVNTGHGNKNVTALVGSTTETGGTEPVYNYEIFKDYDKLEGNTVKTCVAEDGTSYFRWTMGNPESGTLYYMPTFNKNKDSLVADINGGYNQGTGVISDKDVGEKYDQREYYNSDKSTKPGIEIYDADENTIDEVGSDFSEANLTAKEEAGNIKLKKEVSHTVKEVGTTMGLISMDEWLQKYEECQSMEEGEEKDSARKKLAQYWVYDEDGWVYWSAPIKANTATGRLLDKIEMTQVMDEGWYYGLNVVAQFITAGDMGQDDYTGFYDAKNGTAPTEKALDLLKKIGVDTTDAKPADELGTDDAGDEGGFTVTADGDKLEITGGNSLTYSGTATEFVFAYGGADSGWTLNFKCNNAGYEGAKYSKTEDDSTITVKTADTDKLVATWTKATNTLTMAPGQTLDECAVTAEKQTGTGSASHDLSLNIEFIDWSQLVTMRNITSDEYDKLVEVTEGDDSIMHWNGEGSWTTTKGTEPDGDGGSSTNGYYVRGDEEADSKELVEPEDQVANFRPAFDVNGEANYADLKAGDTVVIGTLYVGSDAASVGYDVGSLSYTASNFPKFTLKTALADKSYQMKAIYIGEGVFVCDRCVITNIEWNQLSAALSTAATT